MASASINRSRLTVQVHALGSEAARRGAERVALRTRASIIGQGRYDTGEMARSIRVIDVTTDVNKPTWRVFSTSKHFGFQELGTPREAPGVGYIYPKNPAGRLRFRPKGSSLFVYARRVRGVKPGHFMKRAAEATQLKDFTDPI